MPPKLLFQIIFPKGIPISDFRHEFLPFIPSRTSVLLAHSHWIFSLKGSSNIT